MSTPFTFAVIADTHIRPAGADTQAVYPSDAEHTARAERAVRMLCDRDPAFVVHLGDLTHTVPGLDSYDAAQERAKRVFAELACPLVVAPGNHDVGDKPDPLAPAPPVDEAGCAAFERHWGPTWRSWDHGGCHFVTLNASLLNSGLDLERQQRRWLEADLDGAERCFVMLHYPPFIHAPDEPPHYDNLAEPARSWLLSLIEQHDVEALFAGHVHNVFLNRHAGVPVVAGPATAFVRPEYSELFALAAAAENGRDDTDKLGLWLVHVHGHGHDLELVRTAAGDGTWEASPPRLPLGVWLRGGYARTVDLPHGDLDEFRRKTARDDYPLLALLDIGITTVRVPLADLADPQTAPRLEELAAHGVEILVFSAGEPSADEVALAGQRRVLITGWEVVLPISAKPGCLEAASAAGAPLILSRAAGDDPRAGGFFSHFPRVGFDLDEELPVDVPASRVAFDIPPDVPAGDGVARAVQRAGALGLGALCHVQLPRGTEHRAHTDDEAVTERVLQALGAAEAHPTARVLIDTFGDKDRGYHPRIGLVDRRGNLRTAARSMRRWPGRGD